MFNKIVIQEEAKFLLDEWGVRICLRYGGQRCVWGAEDGAHLRRYAPLRPESSQINSREIENEVAVGLNS